MRYQVIVGNIGTAYDGDSLKEALMGYHGYKVMSKSGYGRCGGESVILLDNDEMKYEHLPTWEARNSKNKDVLQFNASDSEQAHDWVIEHCDMSQEPWDVTHKNEVPQ
jgi:hypothetical protein